MYSPITVGVGTSSGLCIVFIVCFVFLFLKKLLKYSIVSPLQFHSHHVQGFILVKGFLEKVSTDL